jgi:hypothetical protein
MSLVLLLGWRKQARQTINKTAIAGHSQKINPLNLIKHHLKAPPKSFINKCISSFKNPIFTNFSFILYTLPV